MRWYVLYCCTRKWFLRSVKKNDARCAKPFPVAQAPSAGNLISTFLEHGLDCSWLESRTRRFQRRIASRLHGWCRFSLSEIKRRRGSQQLRADRRLTIHTDWIKLGLLVLSGIFLNLLLQTTVCLLCFFFSSKAPSCKLLEGFPQCCRDPSLTTRHSARFHLACQDAEDKHTFFEKSTNPDTMFGHFSSSKGAMRYPQQTIFLDDHEEEQNVHQAAVKESNKVIEVSSNHFYRAKLLLNIRW